MELSPIYLFSWKLPKILCCKILFMKKKSNAGYFALKIKCHCDVTMFFLQILISYCNFFMSRPLKWGKLGFFIIIFFKYIHLWIHQVCQYYIMGRHSRFLAGKAPKAAATSPACRRCRVLFCKIQARPRPWRPCLPWRPYMLLVYILLVCIDFKLWWS